MSNQQELLRLINCLEASFVLHAFALSLIWHQPGAANTQLTVRLPDQPAVAASVNDRASVARGKIRRLKKPAVQIYFTATALTRRPEMITTPPLAMVLNQADSGQVVFRLFISHTGEVTKVERVFSTLPHELEGQLAFGLFHNQYRAGEINGVAVNSELIVDLKLDSSGSISDNLPVLGQELPASSP